MLICGQTHNESRNKAAVKYKKYFMFMMANRVLQNTGCFPNLPKAACIFDYYDLITRAISALSLPAIFGICT